MFRTVVACLSLLCLAPQITNAREAAPPTLGIFGNTGLPIDDHLRELGWQTLGLHWGRNYKLEDLTPFQVIVIGTYPHIREGVNRNQWNEISPEYNERFQALLDEYVAGGGGLLLPACMHPTSNITSTNSLLTRWGAELLPEQVMDSVNTWTQVGGMGWTWYWTDDIAEHPTTAGVKTLFYPNRHIYVPASWVLKTGRDWTVLVRGAATAKSYPVIRKGERLWPREQPGSYSASPPMVATRNVGKGRVLACGWAPVHCWFNLDHFMVGNVFFTEGSGAVESDGLRWLEQTLAWLAEPAAANGYGGYENQPNHPRYELNGPMDWAKVDIGESKGPWRRGIIGARTALTGGQGTVADYAAAARAAGLDFIAFLEDFSLLDKANWETFRAACQAATTDDLLVLPGAAVKRGRAGTEYFVVSDFPWPQADMLAPEENRIVNYLYAHFNMGLNTHGPFRVGEQPTPPWMSRAYNSQAVVTTVSGKSTWELEPYLYNVGIQDAPKPVAVDLITSPDQVAAAAGRVLNYRQCATWDDLRRTLKNPDAGRPAQIGNGPLITTFQGWNNWPMTDGRYVPGRQRWQFRIIAESDRPLKELTLYDGTRVFRRYELAEPRCDIYVNGLHDRQYQFTVVVTDRDGRIAVRGPANTADQFNRRTMCSDRQNSIGAARQADARGNLVTIPSNFLQGKFQQHGNTPATPASASTISWVPWYWDGTPGPRFSGAVHATMVGGDRPKPQHQWAPVYRMEWPLGNRDVIVQAAATEGLIDKGPHDREYSPVVELPGYRAYSRFIEFKKTPDAPTSMLIEGYYQTLTDGRWPGGGWLFNDRISHTLYGINGRPREDTRWIWRHPGQEDVDMVFPEKNAQINEYRELDPDGYAAFIAPQSCIALFAMDQPLGGWFWLHRENWLRSWFGLARIGETYTAGDRQPFRMVVFSGSVTAAPDTTEIERFRRAFGLDGQPPAYPVESRQGRVLGTRFVLELEAQGGGWQGAVGAAELPHRLPVRVHGVNPDWTCGLVDLDTGDWRSLGVLANLPIPSLPAGHAAYVALDLARERHVWIGNLLTCDAPSLRLTVVPNGTGALAVDAHNPTAKPVRAIIRATPGLIWAPDFDATVTVAAGTTLTLPIVAAP